MDAKKTDDFIEMYGHKWPRKSVNQLNVELACYRDPVLYPTALKPEDHFKNAFRLMWPEEVFQWNDWAELMAWAWCNYRIVTVMGHTLAGKTYNVAHFILLDYLADPTATSSLLTTTKFDALKTRLWGDLLVAIRNATNREAIDAVFKTVSSSNELKFTPRGDKADEKFLIQGVATDRGDTNAGKLRGLNTPRRRLIGDEAQDIADGFYAALKHGMAAPDFKGWALTNPVEKVTKFGEFAMPIGGWGEISDSTLWWKTQYGVGLHLDGRQSPNMKAKKVVNKHLLTKSYFETLKPDTVEYWIFGVGFFPPDGMVARIWTDATLEKAKAPAEFDFTPEACATLDPAFDSDDCVLHIGLLGRLRNNRHCISGKCSIVIKTSVGAAFHEKDYQIAHRVMEICREHDVKPENFIMDQTGNARGVFAILAAEWSDKVQGVYYGGEATARPLRLDDSLTADLQVRYFVSELWFRASFLARDGMLCGLANLDMKTTEDLSSRRYKTVQQGDGARMIAEPKPEMKIRLGRSCDFGDAFSQFGEIMIRKGYLGNIDGSSVKRTWATARKRAVKASARWDEKKEFMST